MTDDAQSSFQKEGRSVSLILKESKPIQDNPIYQLAGNNEKLRPKANRASTEQFAQSNNSERQLTKDREIKNKNFRDRSKNNRLNEADKRNISRGRDQGMKTKGQDLRYDKNKTRKKNRKDLSVNSRPRDIKIKDEDKEREQTITEILYRRFAQNQSHNNNDNSDNINTNQNNNNDCASQASANSNYVNQLTDSVKTRQPAGTEYDVVSNASMQTEALEMRQKQLQNMNMSNKDFIACLNVSKFKPEEIKAKIVNDSIFVEGSHDERLEENGIIARTFSRKYVIPDGYDPSKIQITMYKDKILKIKVPAPVVATGPVRVIPIQHRNENAIIKKNRPEFRNQ